MLSTKFSHTNNKIHVINLLKLVLFSNAPSVFSKFACENLYSELCQPYLQENVFKLRYQPTLSKKSEFQHEINMGLADSLEMIKNHENPVEIYDDLEIREDEKHIFDSVMKHPIKFFSSCMEISSGASSGFDQDDSYLRLLKTADLAVHNLNGGDKVLHYFLKIYSKMPEIIGSKSGGIGLFRYNVGFKWDLGETHGKYTNNIEIKPVQLILEPEFYNAKNTEKYWQIYREFTANVLSEYCKDSQNSNCDVVFTAGRSKQMFDFERVLASWRSEASKTVKTPKTKRIAKASKTAKTTKTSKTAKTTNTRFKRLPKFIQKIVKFGYNGTSSTGQKMISSRMNSRFFGKLAASFNHWNGSVDVVDRKFFESLKREFENFDLNVLSDWVKVKLVIFYRPAMPDKYKNLVTDFYDKLFNRDFSKNRDIRKNANKSKNNNLDIPEPRRADHPDILKSNCFAQTEQFYSWQLSKLFTQKTKNRNDLIKLGTEKYNRVLKTYKKVIAFSENINRNKSMIKLKLDLLHKLKTLSALTGIDESDRWKAVNYGVSESTTSFLKMLRLNTIKRNREKMVIKSGGVSTNKFVWRTRAYQANGFYFRDSNLINFPLARILYAVENNATNDFEFTVAHEISHALDLPNNPHILSFKKCLARYVVKNTGDKDLAVSTLDEHFADALGIKIFEKLYESENLDFKQPLSNFVKSRCGAMNTFYTENYWKKYSKHADFETRVGLAMRNLESCKEGPVCKFPLF